MKSVIFQYLISQPGIFPVSSLWKVGKGLNPEGKSPFPTTFQRQNPADFVRGSSLPIPKHSQPSQIHPLIPRNLFPDSLWIFQHLPKAVVESGWETPPPLGAFLGREFGIRAPRVKQEVAPPPIPNSRIFPDFSQFFPLFPGRR